MHKIPMNMRLSEEARQLMKRLAQKLGITETSVIEMSVRKFAEAEEVREVPKAASSSWNCDYCGELQSAYVPKLTVKLKEQPKQTIEVCAVCHKKLYRTKEIAGEIF